jgi:hypothetical protein
MIDTNTTEGKIAVMEAFARGEKIETTYHGNVLWWTNDTPDWSWGSCDYRIKPQTLEEAVDEYVSNLVINPSRPTPIADHAREGFLNGVNWAVETGYKGGE